MARSGTTDFTKEGDRFLSPNSDLFTNDWIMLSAFSVPAQHGVTRVTKGKAWMGEKIFISFSPPYHTKMHNYCFNVSKCFDQEIGHEALSSPERTCACSTNLCFRSHGVGAALSPTELRIKEFFSKESPRAIPGAGHGAGEPMPAQGEWRRQGGLRWSRC